MIRYTSRSGIVCLSCFTLRSAVTTFKVPLLVSFFAAFATLGVGMLKQASPDLFSHSSLHPTFYATFSSVVGFMVVFRTSQGYGRFWEGTSMVYKMHGEWFAGVSTLLAYCSHSCANEELVTEFQQRVVRYVSFLNALILAKLEDGTEDEDHAQALTYPLLDVAGLDHESIMSLDGVENKQEVVFQWIQTLVVEAIDSGVMSIPAPLLTRVFQQFGNGMICYHEMLKFPNVPLPFPFVIVTEVLLLIHLSISPVMLVSWFDDLVFPATFAFVLVLALWCLHVIAGELENPLGSDDNDLDMRAMQTRLNSWLVELVSGPSLKPPKLACTKGSLSRLTTSSDSWATVHDSSMQRVVEEHDVDTQSITSLEETVPGEAGGLDMERCTMPYPARQLTSEFIPTFHSPGGGLVIETGAIPISARQRTSEFIPTFHSPDSKGLVVRHGVPDGSPPPPQSREPSAFRTAHVESVGDLEAP